MDYKKLSEKINQALAGIEATVDSITYTKKGKYYFLEIVLDKVGGIDLDTIVDATNIINPLLDKEDIKESYILDVSSKERGN